MIAYCGIDCESCPIHLATLEPDNAKRDAMRTSVAQLLAAQYHVDLTVRDISDCDGCQTDRLFTVCARCQIRACAVSRSLQSCASCQDYACDRLLKHFDSYPATKVRLDALRSPS